MTNERLSELADGLMKARYTNEDHFQALVLQALSEAEAEGTISSSTSTSTSKSTSKREGFAFRPWTCDENVYRSVVELNEYRLPEKFKPNDVIFDVGAHIGSFAKACLDRGAGKVYCFEPDAENFYMARANLGKEIRDGRVVIFPVALWRSDMRSIMFLRYSGYTKSEVETNTGAGDVVRGDEGTAVIGIAFNSIANELMGLNRIRLLKLDCEYSEWPIIYTARLHRIDAICGEYHELEKEEIPPHAEVSGEHLFDVATLKLGLENDGFKFESEPTPNSNLGKFWASRPHNNFRFSEARA